MTDILDELYATVVDRKLHPRPGSYTNRLLDEGRSRVAQKVGEEAVEVVVAALSQSKQRQVEEMCDLLYHLMVLMADLDITLSDVFSELEYRHRK
ncbi:MAG: phosphoribosyl-ATP diphosphatase [Candidatus Flexifilum sp.]|jgi:phosphoribosyl-ATP pyrophosphohydrolase